MYKQIKYNKYQNTQWWTATLDFGYNQRLQPASFKVANSNAQPGVNEMFREFDYQADGQASFVHDRVNSKFDRAFSYDFAGRLTQALTGYEARGEQYGVQGPFKQVYQHDAWDNTTVRNNRHWSNFFYYSAAYDSHNREVNDPAWQYDAAGHMTQDDQYRQHKYDAAGRKVEVSNYEGAITQRFDGDGQRIKQVQTVTNPAASEVTYYLRSSVLRGATVTELYATGNKKQTNIYAGSAVIARQQVAPGPNIWGRISQTVAWQYSEPVTGSGRSDDGAETSELDPLGVDAGLINPYIDPNYDSDWPLMKHGDAANPGSGCMLDGLPINCNFVREMVRITGRVEAFNPLGDLAGAPALGGGGNWLWINQTTHVRSRAVGPGVEDSSWSPGDTRMTGDWLFIGGLIAEGRQFAHAPQNPAPQIDQKKYDGCAKLLGKSPRPSKLASEAILWTSSQERTDATLIAVTWFEESGFDFRPGPNPRKDGGFDVGPLQTSTTVFGKDRFVNGLSDDAGEVKGTFATKGVPFNGDPYLALRWGARALNDGAGIRGRPKDVSARADMAGIYRAGSSRTGPYRTRVNEFNAFQSGYDAFFNCLRK